MTIAEKLPPMQTVRGHSFNEDLVQGPFYFDGCDTLVKLFRQRCLELGPQIAHREKDFGIWLSYSWTDFYEHARLIGLGLLALGLKRGEAVSILSEDNKEWIYADLAIQSVGGISSGVYTTDSAKQLAYLVNDSDSRFLLVENDEQLDKFLSIRGEMPGLSKVIVFDRDGLHDFADDQVIFLDDLYRIGRDYLNLHSPSGVSFEVKIACIRALDKDFLPQAAPAVAQTAGSGRIRPRSRCFLAQGRRFSAQRTDLSSRFRSV
ncbi:AMP-binding protein [Aliihoeflea sp. PC F10.4]